MSAFHFKNFSIRQADSAMKIGTDAMLLGALANVEETSTILDIGAGTGVIGMMLAQRCENAQVSAVEIDEKSAQECEQNFVNSPWPERMELIQSNFLKHDFTGKFDLIVSNPPYFQNALHNQDLRKANSRHEASLPYDELLSRAYRMLSEKGRLFVILPHDLHEVWNEYAASIGLYKFEVIQIRGVENGSYVRTIIGWHKQFTEIKVSDFTIRDKDGKYTTEYIELTKEFHDRIPS